MGRERRTSCVGLRSVCGESACRKTLRTAAVLASACALATSALLADVPIGAPSAEWTPLVCYENAGDGVTSRQETDFVGIVPNIPAFAYATDGDTLAFRLRLASDQPTAGQFNSFAFVGIDGNSDGRLDLYARVSWYWGMSLHAPAATGSNTSWNTAAISDSALVGYSKSATNYAYKPTATVDIGTPSGINGTSGPNYFLDFAIPVSDVVSQLSARGITVNNNDISTLHYLAATSTNTTTISEDVAGIGSKSQFGDMPWAGSALVANNSPATWRSGAVGDWSTTANWMNNLKPSDTRAASIPNGGTASIQTGTTATARGLSIDNGTVHLEGGSLRVFGPLAGTAASTISVASARTLTIGENNTGVATYAGIITGSGTVNKEGAGTQQFTRPSQAFTGTINVNGGTLDAYALSGTVNVNTAASVSACGPNGEAVGALNFSGSQFTFKAGSRLVWDLAALTTETSAAGAYYDQVNIGSGSSTVSASGGAVVPRFSDIAIGGPDADIPFWQTKHTWTLIDNNGRWSSSGTQLPKVANADGTPFSSSAGSFTTAYSNNDLVLVWNPLPNATRAFAAAGVEQLQQEYGLDGSGVKIGMMEAHGVPDTAHPALANNSNLTIGWGSTDGHATTVAGIIVGRQRGPINLPALPPASGGQDYVYWGGAPSAELEAVHAGSNLSMAATVETWMGAQRKDVVNGSLGIDGENIGNRDLMMTIDRVADSERTVFVFASGDSEFDIPCPARAYNVLAVGALTSYNFSSSEHAEPANWQKRTQYSPPIATSIQDQDWKYRRSASGWDRAPDVLAPGDFRVPFAVSEGYKRDSGTSYATPIVSGGVALMIQQARNTGNLSFVDDQGRVDPRAIRSAILTGADKSIKNSDGFGWSVQADGTQPLDWQLGAGGFDAMESTKVLLSHNDPTRKMFFSEFTSSDVLVGLSGIHLDQGMSLVASLVWNAEVTNTGIFVEGTSVRMTELGLYLYADGTTAPVAQSISPYDNVQHIYKQALKAGSYHLSVGLLDGSSIVRPDGVEPFALSYRTFMESYALFGATAENVNVTTQTKENFQSQFPAQLPTDSTPLGKAIEISGLDLAADSFFTLKLAYDDDPSSLDGVEEATLRLYWYKQSADGGEWVLAGNDANNTKYDAAHFVLGAPTSQYGDWGVDVNNNFVWANVDHASTYAPFGAAVPEPAMLAVFGVSSSLLCLRRRRVASQRLS